MELNDPTLYNPMMLVYHMVGYQLLLRTRVIGYQSICRQYKKSMCVLALSVRDIHVLYMYHIRGYIMYTYIHVYMCIAPLPSGFCLASVIIQYVHVQNIAYYPEPFGLKFSKSHINYIAKTIGFITHSHIYLHVNNVLIKYDYHIYLLLC